MQCCHSRQQCRGSIARQQGIATGSNSKAMARCCRQQCQAIPAEEEMQQCSNGGIATGSI